MIGKQTKTMRMPSTASRISSGSFVKADTASRGAMIAHQESRRP